MTDGIRDALGMDSKNRENRDGETVVEASELRALRQQLHREREARERAERERDRYTLLLELAKRILEGVPEAQAKTVDGSVYDGEWLAAHIQDVLEGEA